jgi:HAD superfamily hydrolase (TIGR01490 family)
MGRPIALFDIDNTMYAGFSYMALLQAQAGEGLISPGAVTEAEASMQKLVSKQQDYETTVVELLDIYARALAGKNYEEVLKSTKRFYQNADKFFDYVAPTITLLHNTHDISLVTGEPQSVAEAVAELFGVKTYYSTEYEVQGGAFTGSITSYLASRHEKHDAIKHLMQGHGAKHSFAFGDSEGDIEMLRAVEHPICLNCSDGLRKVAENEGWPTPEINEVTKLVEELNT